MSGPPAPNQLRWMAGRAALLAAVTGAAVAFVYGGFEETGNTAFGTAFVIGCLAAATSFSVSLVLFYVLMPRLDPRLAVWASLALGALAAFALGSVLQPIARPV